MFLGTGTNCQICQILHMMDSSESCNRFIVRQTGAHLRPKYKLFYIRCYFAVYCYGGIRSQSNIKLRYLELFFLSMDADLIFMGGSHYWSLIRIHKKKTDIVHFIL